MDKPTHVRSVASNVLSYLTITDIFIVNVMYAIVTPLHHLHVSSFVCVTTNFRCRVFLKNGYHCSISVLDLSYNVHVNLLFSSVLPLKLILLIINIPKVKLRSLLETTKLSIIRFDS